MRSSPLFHLCIFHNDCLSRIVQYAQQREIENKYKIVCPVCNVKTLTYDIRHLIISVTEQDEDLYVTTKYLSKKPEVQTKKNKMPVKDSKQLCQRNTLGHTKTKSAHTYNGAYTPSLSQPINFQCKNHAGLNLQYYCDECSKNSDNSQIFFCYQCAKDHSNRQHKLISIRQANSHLDLKNTVKREQTLPSRKKQLQSMLKVLYSRQEGINDEFQKLYKDLNEEFKQIYQTVNDQYQCLKKQVKSTYTKQCQEVKTNIQFIQRLKDSLNGLQKMYALDSTDIESQVSFYVFSTQIQKAIDTNKTKLGKIPSTPKLMKKISALVLSSTQKLIELGYQNKHRKTMSKLVSPKNGSITLNQQIDTELKKGKGHFNFQLYNSLKENFAIGSPKASFEYRN